MTPTVAPRIGRVPVQLDYLQANQLLAATEARLALLEGWALYFTTRGVPVEDVLSHAIADTQAAEFALRAAFDLTEAHLDAEHEALHRELDELREAEDVPRALDSYWNRGA